LTGVIAAPEKVKSPVPAVYLKAAARSTDYKMIKSPVDRIMSEESLPLPRSPWPIDDPAVRVALLAALADGSWGRYEGRHGAALVAALRELLQIEHVYPCCSGTFAVELALRMLKVGPGDEVILAGYDFPGNFRAIEAVGAKPVLVDIVPRRWHLDPGQLAAAASPQVKAIVVSHLHGVLAPMPEIVAIARQYGWQVVEDACQMTGAIVGGRAAGTWGDVGTFSFGGSKLLTAGRGGAVFTSDPTLLQRAKVYCERGNHAYPLSELQAAVLVPQIAALEKRNVQRQKAVERIVAAYEAQCQGQATALRPAAVTYAPDQTAYYKLGWLVEWLDDNAGFTRTQTVRESLAKTLQAAGVEIDAGFRGFSRRADSRCHKPVPQTASEQAAAGTVVLHHPVLLSDDAALDWLSRTLAAAAKVVGSDRVG
jgi:perosamine synthetase